MKQYPKTTIAVLPFPHVLSVNVSENGAVEFGEFEGKFLQEVLGVLGTDYNAIVPKDMSFGSLLPNGSWTGMVGMVHRGEADLAFTYLSVTEERMKAVSFSTVYAVDACIFITVLPETIKSTFAFLHPFVITTWIAVFLTVSLMAILFAKFNKRKYTVFKTFFKLFANFFRQASMPEGSSLKYKVLLMIWLLFAMVISLSYSGTLLSFLIRPLKNTMIRTFSDLSKAVQRGTHKAIFFNFSLSFLLNSEDDDLIVLGEIVQRNNWLVDVNKRGSFSNIKSNSILTSRRNLGRLMYGNRDDLYIAEDTLYVTPMAFAYGKNFCCPSKLNLIILRLSGAGLYEKILRDVSLKYFLKIARTSKTSSRVSPLSISDLLGSFMLLSVGLTLSFGVFIGEVLYGVLYSARK